MMDIRLDLTMAYLIPILLYFILFILILIYYWRKKEHESKREVASKAATTCILSLICLAIATALIISVVTIIW
jgi:RsiW-degrading membrane proteinase PrsW (M82 family)